MPVFEYTTRNARGRTEKNVRHAASASELAGDLRAQGLLVIDVREKSADGDELFAALENVNPASWLPVRSLDMEISLQQLAVMTRSGLTLLSALRTLGEQSTRRRMGLVWKEVSERIQEGMSFSDAVAQHRCFPHLVVQLIRVGEQTGFLNPVLVRGAAALERRRMLQSSLVTALMYPAIVLFAAIGVTVFMVVSVLPKLEQFLASLGRTLPPMTQNLIDISRFFQTNGIAIIIAIVALLASGIAFYFWPPGRKTFDRIMLRLPVLGPILRVAGTASFSHVLGTLLKSGISLTEAMRTLETTLGNKHLSEVVLVARENILHGGNLHEPLGARHGFMPMLSRMAAVGETSGTLDEVMEELAEFHEAQLKGIIRRLSAIIEPVIILVVGAIVGYVYIAFFMALFAAGGPQ